MLLPSGRDKVYVLRDYERAQEYHEITALPLLFFILLGFDHKPTRNTVNLGKEFNIKKGQEVIFKAEKLRITFKTVSSDSRCPTGVQCGWAGNAAIEIQVSKDNDVHWWRR